MLNYQRTAKLHQEPLFSSLSPRQQLLLEISLVHLHTVPAPPNSAFWVPLLSCPIPDSALCYLDQLSLSSFFPLFCTS